LLIKIYYQGNWSIYTSEFTERPLFSYFNALYPFTVLQAEEDLMELVREEGPFDGVIAYSMGAMLASQVIMRCARENPYDPPPFRFAVFINGATPIRAFPIEKLKMSAHNVQIPTLTEEVTSALLRKSNLKGMKGQKETEKPTFKLEDMALETMMAENGRLFLTDGEIGIWRYDAAYDGIEIDIPTLHVRDLGDEPDQGLELLKLCDGSHAKEYYHIHGHDFPRGYAEMTTIAKLIRATAELA